MKRVLFRSEMQEADQRTDREMHVPSAVLMERAALSVADSAESEYLRRKAKGDILIVCGSGNNGGDGFAAGRILMERGFSVSFCFIGSMNKCTPLTKEQILSIKALKPELQLLEKVPDNTDFPVIIDALIGISLSRELTGVYAEAVEMINGLHEAGAFVIAIDIPSGVEADSGKVLGYAVAADLTVACAFLKPGHLLYPGAAKAGRVVVANIGITGKALEIGNTSQSGIAAAPDEALLSIGNEETGKRVQEAARDKDLDSGTKRGGIYVLEDSDIILPDRPADSHKGTFGKVLLIAGSAHIAGAAALSALAALRTGAGMVQVFTHYNNRSVVQSVVPEALVTVYGEGDDYIRAEEGETFEAPSALPSNEEKRLHELFNWCDVIAIGPGIGTDNRAYWLLEAVLLSESDKPLVIDADGLNLLKEKLILLSQYKGDIILTPHLGEMGRLIGKGVSEIKEDLIGTARDFAMEHSISLVLKDSRSIIALPEGRIFININGNSGMATAGSGDVLTGMIAGLLAQGVPALLAAPLGAALHGKAGDITKERVGAHAMLAGDILAAVSKFL